MLDVRSLVFSYPKQPSPTLKGLDFHIDEGEVFGFLGPSGSGKSTTQRLLIGLLKDYQGEISILNKDARAWGTDLYHELGVGFEDRGYDRGQRAFVLARTGGSTGGLKVEVGASEDNPVYNPAFVINGWAPPRRSSRSTARRSPEARTSDSATGTDSRGRT